MTSTTATRDDIDTIVDQLPNTALFGLRGTGSMVSFTTEMRSIIMDLQKMNLAPEAIHVEQDDQGNTEISIRIPGTEFYVDRVILVDELLRIIPRDLRGRDAYRAMAKLLLDVAAGASAAAKVFAAL